MFPENFYWGGATAANQIEGGYNEGGRSPILFDYVTAGSYEKERTVTYTLPGDNRKHSAPQRTMELPENAELTVFPDEYYPNHKASDFYHRYREDIRLLGEMGLKMFRMSIAWSRIYPTADGGPNPEGIAFYRDIFRELRKYQIEPLVTLSHYDTPLYIEKNGGWENRDTIDRFVTYCETVFREFSQDVKYWITFNEINVLIPFKTWLNGKSYPVSNFMKLHNQFVAAAKVVKLGHEINPDFRIGCMIGGSCSYPYSSDPKDAIANMEFMQEHVFYPLDVMVRGAYPAYAVRIWRETDGSVEITDEDLNVLREGKADFISFSYYCSMVTTADTNVPNDAMGNLQLGPKNGHLRYSEWGWSIDPDGLRYFLNELYGRYEKPLLIAECGLGARDTLEADGTVHDTYRIDYLREHFRAIEQALDDGVPIMGITTWGCIDLISGSTGEMSKRYGYLYVDCDDQGKGTYDRYKKDSYYWYQKCIASNGEQM